MLLSIDFETRSRKDISGGVSAYFADPSTEVLCAAWAFDEILLDGIPVWRPGERCPKSICDHIESGGAIFGWNVAFERRCIETIMHPVHGWPLPRLDQYHDTAALAAAMSLPRDLEEAAIMMRLNQQKDAEGHRLMLRMSKPNRSGGFDDSPEMRARLEEYCAQDVRTERAVRRKLRRLQAEERELWLLDQVINDRGVRVDIPLIRSMLEIATQAGRDLDEELHRITAGRVHKASGLPAIKTFLRDQGLQVDKLRKEDFAPLLDITAGVSRRVIEIRKEAATSSNAKLQAALDSVGKDGRVRDLFLFHGAHTGRWAGKNLNPQNFPRGSDLVKDSDSAVTFLRSGRTDVIDLVYGNPLRAVSDCLRGIFIPAPGMKFVVADFRQIEARLTAWIAGEQHVLDAFVAGRDLYKISAGGIYRVNSDAIDDKDPRRQVGKATTLSMGFGGGVNALANMGRIYGVDFAKTLPGVWEVAGADRREKVEKKYEDTFKRGNAKLPQNAWMACELIKRAWRDDNPAIVASWYEVDNACWQAMSSPGIEFEACRVSLLHENGFLWMRLPSGRQLAYADPRIKHIEPPWSDKTQPKAAREKQPAVTVASGSPGKQMAQRDALWPGVTVQAAVQATARDLLAIGMKAAEAAGYRIVMHSHDEVIAEHKNPDLDEFCALMCQAPDWAAGLPYTANGWIGDRYKKE